VFEDPIWEDRLERLMRFTTRTETIVKLTGTDVRPQRIKDHVDRLHEEMYGEKPQRPRGVGRSFSSQGFLATKFERFDAAYLCALHFGSRGPEFAEPDSDLGRACDKKLEVYTLYASLYPASEPRLSFETYDVLIDGVRSRAIELHTCPDCGSRHPWAADAISVPTCSVCAVIDLRMSSARRDIESRQHQRRREVQVACNA
jgi:hypothetical protein